MSEALDVREAPVTGMEKRLRANFDPAQVALIKQTVAKDCSDAELGMVLELSARYQLDPFAKQIWAIKLGGKLQIFVSHTGLLQIANRYPDFMRVDSNVVCEKDEFWTEVNPEGEVIVHHKVSEGDIEKRGEILGAWATVHRKGKGRTYFYAPAKEYDKKQNVWKSHPSAMITKAAESVALRRAFSIGGIIAAEEAGQEPQNLTAVAADHYGEDPLVAAQIRQLFDLLDYPQRKRTVRLAAGPGGTPLDEKGLWGLMQSLLDEAKARGIEVPPLDAEGTVEEVPEAEPA